MPGERAKSHSTEATWIDHKGIMLNEKTHLSRLHTMILVIKQSVTKLYRSVAGDRESPNGDSRWENEEVAWESSFTAKGRFQKEYSEECMNK
jgi:hypothetical protein